MITLIQKRIAEKEKDYSEDLVQAINFAYHMIKKGDAPKFAINKAAKYYNVDPKKVTSGNASRINIIRWAKWQTNKKYSPYIYKDK